MKKLFLKYVEFQLIKKLILFYTFIVIIDFLRSFYFLYQGTGKITDDLLGLIKVSLVDWFFVITFMSFIAILTKRLLSKNIAWNKILLLHVFLSIFQSYMTGLIAPMIMSYDLINPSFSFLDKATHTFFFNFTTNLLLYSAIILIIYNYFYVQKIKKEQIKNKILENNIVKVRLKVLENQLHPHFLFNTLNSISSLISRDPVAAQDMIVDISFLLRKFLNIDNSNLISIEEELLILEHYTNILHLRFQDDLEVRYDVDKSICRKKIPRLLIQSIIENSVKHGFSTEHKKLIVNISIKKLDKFIGITVENNGAKLIDKPVYSNSGIGLVNLKERLQALYNDKFRFNFYNTEYGVKTEILIGLSAA